MEKETVFLYIFAWGHIELAGTYRKHTSEKILEGNMTCDKLPLQRKI